MVKKVAASGNKLALGRVLTVIKLFAVGKQFTSNCSGKRIRSDKDGCSNASD